VALPRTLIRNGTIALSLVLASLLFIGGMFLIRSLQSHDDERLSFELYRIGVDILGAIAEGQSPVLPQEVGGFLYLGGRAEVIAQGGQGQPPATIAVPNGMWTDGPLVYYHRQITGGGGSGLRTETTGGRQLVLWYDPSAIRTEQQIRDWGLYGGLVLLTFLTGFVGFLSRSLTTVQERLARQERLALLGQAARTISHEIQNPLAALELHRQLAQSKLPPSSDLSPHLLVIKTEAQRIQHIIANVRTLIHPQEGSPQGVSARQAITRVSTRLHKPGGPELLPPPGDKDVVFFIDPQHLETILMNLGTNALQSQELAGSTQPLVFDLERRGKKGILRLVDSGVGLEPGAGSKLFDPFYTTKDSGTGLGLSLALALAKNAGGSLEVRNNPAGPGCTATLTLPVAGESP